MTDWNARAPDGQVWLCPGCGRTADVRSQMGDTSCVLWATLVTVASIERAADGRIVRAAAAAPESGGGS